VKPQIERAALDGRDASPHLNRMADKEKPVRPAASARETKLAQALRANLRRRKVTEAGPPLKPQDSSTD